MAEVAGKKFERQSIVAPQCGKTVLAPFCIRLVLSLLL